MKRQQSKRGSEHLDSAWPAHLRFDGPSREIRLPEQSSKTARIIAGQEEKLARLADLDDIRDLARRFCHYTWQRDIAALVALFTEEGAFAAELGHKRIEARGPSQLRDAFSDPGSPPEYFRHPLTQAHIVDLDGDTATGWCYLDGQLLHAPGELTFYGGVYEDRYHRTNSGWRIHNRLFHIKILYYNFTRAAAP